MSDSRMILLVISIIACLSAQTVCNAQYTDFDDTTGCPLNVDHVCAYCAKDNNRLGCYCEDDEIITANIFTPCRPVDDDPCSNHSCKNGAGCIREGFLNYKCNCTIGFGGAMCDTPLPKCSDANVECLNAVCVETTDPVLPVYCQCYDGTRRDPRLNATCPTNPCYVPGTETPICANGGTCRIVNNAFVCECTAGYAGQNCTKALKTPLCESQPNVCGEGKCQQSLTPPFYSCTCGNHPSTFASALTGLTKCEQSGCYSSNPCLNGGTCSNKANGAFLCQCPPRYTGSKCERQSACYSNPCVNGGTCNAVNETLYFCTCPAYYSGQRCEISVPNPCITKNCGLYGVCLDSQGTAVCNCSDKIHVDNSPCENPCLTRNCGVGVCTKKANANNEAVCSCPVSRKGEFCELPRDPCRESPRCGGGYCKPNYASTRGYTCVCEGPVSQADPCPFPKNCPIKDCGTKGICVETDGIVTGTGAKPIYYVCLCQNGYISSGSCDTLLDTDVPAAVATCGSEGKPYPSRNPNNPIGCWCNNGTHIEEIREDDPKPYCV